MNIHSVQCVMSCHVMSCHVKYLQLMNQERFNSLMILHVHKDLTDVLDLPSVANEFVSNTNKVNVEPMCLVNFKIM